MQNRHIRNNPNATGMYEQDVVAGIVSYMHPKLATLTGEHDRVQLAENELEVLATMEAKEGVGK